VAATFRGRDDQRARNEALLRAKVLVELDKGARFLEQRVQHMFPGMAGMLLNPLAGLAYRTIGREEIVRRANQQLDIILAAAHAHGATPEAIFDGHLTRYLQADEAWARANRAHPRFPELEGLLKEVYVARVEPVSMMLHRGVGDTYPDLVRSVFPNRAHAAQLLEREFVYADRILVLAQSEPNLLHAPPLVKREVLGVLRDAYGWYKGAMHRSLDDIYASPMPTPGPNGGAWMLQAPTTPSSEPS
jgi:hypothetical protein